MAGQGLVFLNNASISSYPSGKNHRSTYFKSLYDTDNLPWGQRPTQCLCYTYSKNYIYKPHTAYGMVGTTAAAYLGRRRRL